MPYCNLFINLNYASPSPADMPHYYTTKQSYIKIFKQNKSHPVLAGIQIFTIDNEYYLYEIMNIIYL